MMWSLPFGGTSVPGGSVPSHESTMAWRGASAPHGYNPRRQAFWPQSAEHTDPESQSSHVPSPGGVQWKFSAGILAAPALIENWVLLSHSGSDF
jgi:hypothetical protein